VRKGEIESSDPFEPRPGIFFVVRPAAADIRKPIFCLFIKREKGPSFQLGDYDAPLGGMDDARTKKKTEIDPLWPIP